MRQFFRIVLMVPLLLPLAACGEGDPMKLLEGSRWGCHRSGHEGIKSILIFGKNSMTMTTPPGTFPPMVLSTDFEVKRQSDTSDPGKGFYDVFLTARNDTAFGTFVDGQVSTGFFGGAVVNHEPNDPFAVTIPEIRIAFFSDNPEARLAYDTASATCNRL